MDAIPTGAGHPLDIATRQPLEAHFQSDLSGVRVHTDSQAAHSAASIDALAYTTGRDIYFAAGMYAPANRDGQQLLAHEVAHVVQRSSGLTPGIAAKSAHGVVIGAADDPLEAEADRAAEEFTSGAHPADLTEEERKKHESTGTVQRFIQRQEKLSGAAPSAVVLRQSAKPAKSDAPPQFSPENSMRSNIEEMRVTALPKFQSAIDAIDEAAINAAGDKIVDIWKRVQGSYEDVPAVGINATISDKTASEAKPDDVERDYKAARRDVLKSVNTQVFRGAPVLGKVTIPDSPGSLVAVISSQKAQAAWVAKDTAALIAILKQEKRTESEQWQAVGLLRQHLNPWHFGYMRKALSAAGLEATFDTFALSTHNAYLTLLGTVADIQGKGDVGVLDEVGSLALLPTQSKVRLLQPMTPVEVSGAIYGKPNDWATLLVPFNSAQLKNKSGQEWLLRGTELIIDPTMLLPQYAMMFAVTMKAQSIKDEQAGNPILRAEGNSIAVVGNQITYSVYFPSTGMWPDVNIEWWIENDPAAVANGKAPATERGPKGLYAIDRPRSHDTSLKRTAAAAGTHTIHCRLTYGNSVTDLTYSQTVITLEQMIKIELVRGVDLGGDRPKEIVEKLRKELAETADTPENKRKRDDLTKRIADIEKSLQDAKGAHMDPVPAVFISSAEKPLRLPLRLFLGDNREFNDADKGYHLQLWDYTLQGQPFTITEDGTRLMPTIEALFHTFADKCYYPKGSLLIHLSASRLTYSNVNDLQLTLPTSGPKLIDEILRLLPPDALRAISMGALGLAAVSGLLGQEEIAIPSFELSLYLGGAAAAGELAQKLEHGQFKWDVGTAMQIADLTAALIGMAGAFELTTAVGGVGRVSLTPALSGLGKGIGLMQVGVIAGVHATEIVGAIRSKDKKALEAAILRALGDAALFIIVHRASAKMAGKGLEGQPEFVPHEQLRPAAEGETLAADRHGVVVTKDGRVFRCSDDCADLRWLFERLLEERPEIAKQLADVANKPANERLDAARALYEKLSGLRNIRNLSNAELADKIAKSRGSKIETELKAERLRREGIDVSPWEFLESHGFGAPGDTGPRAVPDAFEVGNFAHNLYERLNGMIGGLRVTSVDLPAGVIKEYTIPDNRLPFEKRPRIDRLDRNAGMIYEIKPTSQAARGEAQGKSYVELMNRFDPRPGGWRYEVVTYDEARVTNFLRNAGVLTP